MDEKDWLQKELRGTTDGKIPAEADLAIAQGIQRAKALRRRNRTFLTAAASFVLLVSVFGTMIHVSPAFAAAIRQIPGMEIFVRIMGTQDKGLARAVDNEFFQPINISHTQNGETVTLNGVIADESRIVVFYSWNSDHSAWKRGPEVKLNPADGSYMPAVIGFQHSPVPSEPVSSGSDYLDAMLVEGTPMPDDFIFEVKLAGEDGPVWKVPVKLDRELFMNRAETIPIGKSVVIQGQTVTFNEAKLYPTRILLDVSYEESNTKQLFGLRDIHLVTEKGERLSSWGASNISENKKILTFESSYFTQPKELYLEGSLVTALDKDQLTVKLDVANKRIVSPDNRLQLLKLTDMGDSYAVSLKLSGLDSSWDNMSYMAGTGSWEDAHGNTVEVSNHTSSRTLGEDPESNASLESFTIPKKDYGGVLTTTLHEWPNALKAPYRIRIK
ncbi:hypothetical protein YDYSY3_58170 [Paenibacillus chitinolyticus]|uniref:DUF4179 domain-containing protein n=1 Tax=Paenibacillus chitinolyticus TaxID=79263 RepID=UPI0026E4BA41|nr:DUF4179 domain-containing protein [Paenibacillus chitinolyticus]GKS14817.1 hypothetical protein YDYSY3_58170 [Paenibacillus chitinolyticus]